MPRYSYAPSNVRLDGPVAIERARREAEEARQLANDERSREVAQALLEAKAKHDASSRGKPRERQPRPYVAVGFEETVQRLFEGVRASDVPRVASGRRSGRRNWRQTIRSDYRPRRDDGVPTNDPTAVLALNQRRPFRPRAHRLDHGHVPTTSWASEDSPTPDRFMTA